MSESLGHLKRHLLAMIGGGPPPSLSLEKWQQLTVMAGQHRVQPILAFRFSNAVPDREIPAAVLAQWEDARERAGFVTLAQQAALRIAVARLDEAGIAFVALKGPRLAWVCYPEHSLRPMRDLDLLVAPDKVLRAAQVLIDAGFVMDASDNMLARAMAAHKHLPPVWHAQLDVTIELHHRLVDPPGLRGYFVPQLDPVAMIASSQPILLANVAVQCPSATSLLAHLMVHALYDHLLDCGPLILADIHYLLATESIDSDALARTAEKEGWLRGATLLLALTEKYFGRQPIDLGSPPPDKVVAAAEDALLPDFDKREHRLALTDLLAARSLHAFVGALTMRMRPSENVVFLEGGGNRRAFFWLSWAYRRLSRLAGRLADRRAAAEGGNAVTLMRWLQG